MAFGVAPRIDAAGRIAHPAEALAVFEAALDEEAAHQSVERLNQLNQERRHTVKAHFEELVESIGTNVAAGLVVYRETSPKGMAGSSEQMRREVFGAVVSFDDLSFFTLCLW